MKSSQRSIKIANVFGSFGYLSILVQWFWFIAVIVLPYLQESSIKNIFLPTHSSHQSSASSVQLPAGVQIGVTVVAIVFSLAIIVYAVYAIPRTIGKAGKKLTQGSAHVVVSNITHHHKPLTKQERKYLYEYVTWSMKLLLLLLPCALLLVPTHTTLKIPHEVVLLIGVFCALMSLVWFALQYCVSRFSHSDPRDIW